MENSLKILDHTDIKEMQNIIDYLKEGKKHVQYSIAKNVILILGKAGSGKSILTQFMAGNEDLVSEKSKDSAGYFIIEEGQTKKLDLDNWQTFVPNLVQDTKTNTTFYDCPGFLNTINEANDIAASYYIKNVIDSSGSVKLVFTINHDSFKNEKDFLSQLVKPAIKLVKNIEKFKNSIVLIVTKVIDSKEIREKDVEFPDESIISDIAAFLRNITVELKNHVRNNHLIYSKDIYDAGIPFIKALLSSKKGKFSKVGIFKMPAESGKLSNMTLLQENKESLKKIINENIVFSPHNEKDFGYSLSGESILYIKSVSNEINKKIADEIKKIEKQIEQHYCNQEEQSHDTKALYDELFLSYKTLTNLQAEMLEFTEPQQLVMQIMKNIKDLNLSNILDSIFHRMLNYAEYITFFSNLMENESTLIDSSEWAHALSETIEFLDDSQKWYHFLNNLPILLSKYDVQRNLSQYSEAIGNFQSQMVRTDQNKQSIMESLKVLLYEINKEDFEREINEVKYVILNNHKLKILNRILNRTLKNNTTLLREGDKLTIKSRYAKLSDIAGEDLTHIKSVEIFAYNKVFVDANLCSTADLSQIFIIAPEWEIINYPEIRLNNKYELAVNVKKFVGIGQDFHGHGYLNIFTENGKANNEQWFGKNIKIISGEQLFVKNNDNIIDTKDLIIIKLSDHFVFSVNELGRTIQIKDAENEKNTRIQDTERDINIHFTINKFKRYMRESLNSDIQKKLNSDNQESFLRKFLERLENHKFVKNSYSALGFINELYDIEDQFFTYRKHISFFPFYQSFLHRIKEYADNNINTLTNDDKKVLSYLNAVAVSKVYCNDDDIPDYFADHLNKILETVSKDIEKLIQSDDINDAVFINDCRLNEHKLIEETSNEICNFINSQIKPYLDVLNKKELNLNELIKLRMLSNTLKKVTEFLNFVGSLGVRATSIIKGNTTNEGHDEINVYNLYPITDLSTTLQNFNLNMESQLENKKQLLKEVFTEVEQELTLFLKTHPSSEFNEIWSKISESKQNLSRITSDSLSMDKLYNIQEEIYMLLQNQKKALQKQNPQTNLSVDDQLKIVNRVINISTMAELPVDFYDEIKSNITNINNVKQIIKQTGIHFKQFVQYEKNINDIIKGTYVAIHDNIKETENSLQIEPYAALTASKWQIQRTLENLQHEIQNLTMSFEIPKYFIQNLEELEKISASIIRMYNQIENLRGKIHWVVYVANIKSSKVTKINLQSETLNIGINKLKLIMRSNLIVKKYESAMEIFKQEIYPFSKYFLEKYELPSALQFTNINTLFSEAASILDSLSDDYLRSRYRITEIDTLIWDRIRNFMSLFKWKHNKYNATIFKLLEGKEVTLKSDVHQTFPNGRRGNAIKFNEVRINFIVANETMQTELNKDLQDFKITMRHSGKSYYQCDKLIHIIPSDSFTISYSLAKNKEGNPLKSNDVYDKLKKHVPVFSPFTTWYIQLSNINKDFKSLEKYKNEVIDLGLEVKITNMWDYYHQFNICIDDLNKYYTLYDTIPTMNNSCPSYKRKREIPNIQSHSRSTQVISRKNISRKRRGDLLLTPNDKFVTSGSSSTMKSSIVNNIVELIGMHFMALRYLNPINKISTWFKKYHKNIIFNREESLALDNNNLFMNSKLLDIQPLTKKLVSHTFAEDKTSRINDAFGYSSICHHGNLLLLDLIVRQKNGIKHKQQNSEMNKVYNYEYAQNLAYRAYVSNIENY